MDEPKDWVLRKRNMFYRPDAAGYTNNFCDAGRYTKSEASFHASAPDGVTMHRAADYAPPPVGSVWSHTKTGNLYSVIGYCRLEADWTEAVLYVRVDGSTELPIARATSQFTDGRFSRIYP